MGELGLLDRIRKRFDRPQDGLITGIGDDAAAVDIDGSTLLISTDTMTEGVHFDLSFMTPYQVGYRLLVCNVSDIYAMGGTPEWALLSITVSSETEDSLIDEFIEGLSEGMKRYGVSLIGGDVTGSTSSFTASVTITGRAGRDVIRRAGASPGENLYISAPLGEAACGLEALRRIGRPVLIERGEVPYTEIDRDALMHILRQFLFPEVHDIASHTENITSMIDISDGLFIDLTRLCTEGSVGARLFEERLPVTHELQTASVFFSLDPYRLITSGGEDYRLLFTSGSDLPSFIRIGEITDEGLFIVRKDGREEEIKPEGYEHFVCRR